MDKLKILIPTDFSDQPQYALVYSENLSKLFDVEVVLLHVLEVNDSISINSDNNYTDLLGVNIEYLNKAKDIALEKLESLNNSLVGQFSEVSSILKVGPLTETIISTSREITADLIIMGKKGASGLREWLSGSDTQIVARHSEIPLLTIMCDRKDEVIKNILFISDFSDIDVAPDPLVTKFARATNAKLHLLCINRAEEEVVSTLEHMKEYTKLHGIDNYEIHVHHDTKVYKGIRQFSELDSMHLIILGTHGRKGIQQLVNSSVAEKLINHLYKPILVYKI